MKFALADLLVRVRNGSETILERMCSSDVVKQYCGETATPDLVGGKSRHTGWFGGDGSKAQALGSDVYIYQSMIF